MQDLLLLIWKWLRRLQDRSLGPAGRGPLVCAQYACLALLKFYRDRGFSLAASLTFSTLLAVVPVSAIFFSVFSAFSAFTEAIQRMRTFLMQHVLPESGLREAFDTYVNNFTSNAFGITFVSLAGVIVTSVLLYITIEDSLNRTYCVRRHPPFLRSLTAYTALLVWGPMLLGLSGYLWIFVEKNQRLHEVFLTAPAEALAPLAVSWLLFLTGYLLLPYTPLDLKGSLIGSFVAAASWEIAKGGFHRYVASAIVYPTLYGPLAVVPLFFLWLYYSWSVFLLGAQIDFLVRSHGMLDVIAQGNESDPVLVSQTNLAAVLAIGKAFLLGQDPPSTRDLARSLGVPAHVVQEGLLALEELRILRAINRRKDVFLLARDPDTVQMGEIFFATVPAAHSVSGDAQEARWARDTVGRAQASLGEVLGTRTLASVLDELYPAAVRESAATGAHAPGPSGSASPMPGPEPHAPPANPPPAARAATGIDPPGTIEAQAAPAPVPMPLAATGEPTANDASAGKSSSLPVPRPLRAVRRE